MKLLFSSLLVTGALSTDCSMGDASNIALDFLSWGTGAAAQGLGCGNFLLDTVQKATEMEDFSKVLGVKEQFCTSTNDCSGFIDSLVAKNKELQTKYPDCHQKVLDAVKTAMQTAKITFESGSTDVVSFLELGKKAVCDINCGAKDAACWTCKGVGMFDTFASDAKCGEVPFCTGSGMGCTKDSSKKCVGGKTLKLLKGQIETVAAKCGDILNAKSVSGATCAADCKTALVEFQAFANEAVQLAKADGGAGALLCLMEAEGDLADSLGDKIPDLGGLLPSVIPSVTEASQLLNDLKASCGYTEKEVEAAMVTSKATLEEAVAEDVQTTESGAAVLAPAVAAVAASALAFTVL